jgi:PAS domain S-box-containing protein
VLSLVRRYGVACLAVLLALMVRLAVDPALGNRQTLATFYVAVAVAAWWGGTGPALLALVAGYLVGDWFFIPPRGVLSLQQPSLADAVGAALYVFVGVVSIGLTSALRRAERRALDRADSALDGASQLVRAAAAAGGGAWEQDLETGDVILSEQLCHMIGLPPARTRLDFAAWRSRVHPDDLEMLDRALEDVKTGRAAFAPEYRVVLPSGEVRWILSRGDLLRDPRGGPRRLAGITFDIGDKRRAEEIQSRLAAIVESSDDAIVGKTLDGVITSWNAAAEQLFGYTADEMIGTHISRLVPPERPDDVSNILGAIRRGERVHHYETERIRKDGSRVQISISVSPIVDASGRIVGASKIARNVTERKRTEALLRANEERRRALLEFNQAVMANMGEGLYTVDTNGLVTTVNPVAERLFGWTSAELLGRKMHEVTHYVHPDGTPFPAEECAGLGVLRSGTPLTDHPDVFIRRDGTFFPVVYSAARIVSGDQVEGLVVVFHDVTQQKQIESEREGLLAAAQQARSEAEAASRAKDDFLSVVSHELRTPLSSMTNWIRVLQKGTGEQAQRAIDGIERAARAQSTLVEDLLDVSRIAAGRLRLDARTLDLRGVVTEALEGVRPAADAKGIRVSCDLGPSPIAVYGDPDRLEQVAWNLLSNAVKFTPAHGEVSITLESRGDVVRLTVRDTGCGIAPEFLPYVFERFVQAESAATRRHGGLGLGLSIVRNLVELHGGTVAVESPGPSRGATFTVTLPSASTRVSDADGKDASTVRLDGLRVLVVDDDSSARHAMRATLEERGAHVLTAGSGHEAHDMLGRAELDVVVNDVRLPNDDGGSLLRALRETARDVPAVALFDDGEDGGALAAGYRAHFAKPVEAEALVSTIARLAAPSPSN